MNLTQEVLQGDSRTPKLDVALESRSQSGRIIRCPVHDEGFTIGTSLSCDLVLLEPGLQTEHAIIRVEKGAVWIQCIDPEDTITVNTRHCHWLALRDGDSILFGSQEFSVRIRAEATFYALPNHQSAVPSPAGVLASTLGSEEVADSDDLSFLSTEELVERLEMEMAIVDEFESRREAGVNALLRAIQETDRHGMNQPLGSDTRAA